MKKSYSSLLNFKILLKLVFYLLPLFITHTIFTQTFPTNFAGIEIAKNLDPVGLEIMKDGRILLAEKTGVIKIIKNGSILATPLMTIPNVDNFSERGLLKVIEDENFASNGFIYCYYTFKSPGNINNRVSRFKVVGDLANPNTEQVLINIEKVDGNNGWHNGGGLAIYNNQLYISVGEHTVASHSQSFSNLKGKVLRINSDGTIPMDNPFYNTLNGSLRAIYALGLRNPFRLTVNKANGKVYLTDVGAGYAEEINELEAGKNFGWPNTEGFLRSGQTPPSNYKDPFYAYLHDANGGCSITALDFHNPAIPNFPTEYLGACFFGDYCSGWIKYINPGTKVVKTFATGINRPLEIVTSNDGTLYFIARGGIPGGSQEANTSSNNGVLWKVNYTGNGKPIIAVNPSDKIVSTGQQAAFEVVISGNPKPTLQWQRNGIDIPNANTEQYVLPSVKLSDNGAKFKIIATNSEGTTTSLEATLTVLDNKPPVAEIKSPAVGYTYDSPQNITFEGTGSDLEDGELTASAFTWKIDFHHFDAPAHVHPAMPETKNIKKGEYNIPNEIETSPNVFFRVYLTVTDSKGISNTVFRDIYPNLVNISLVSNIPGIIVKLDGSNKSTPYEFTGAVGVLRELDAPSPQTINGKTYVFEKWSSNQPPNHKLVTPNENTFFTATYKDVTNSEIVSGNIYELQPQNDLNLRLDVRNGSAANSSIVDASPFDANKLSQKWKLNSVGNNIYQLEPQHALGKSLDIAGASASTNTEIHLFTTGSTAKTNQRFKATLVGEGIYTFEPQNAIGNLVDAVVINGVSTTRSNTAVANRKNQQWRIIPLKPTAIEDNLIKEKLVIFPNPMSDKTIFLFPNQSSNRKTIQILDLQGFIIESIDVSNLPEGRVEWINNRILKGVYIVKFINEDRDMISEKIIFN